MQITYYDLQTKPRVLQSLTGLNPEEFENLLLSFDEAWYQFVEQTFHKKTRKRAYGGGRKSQLEYLEDKLLFILVYFRLYPTQEVQGYLFGMGQTQTNEWVHRLSPLLNQALGYEHQLPERLAVPHRGQVQTLGKRKALQYHLDSSEKSAEQYNDHTQTSLIAFFFSGDPRVWSI